jgi:hypothetical protein
VIELGGARVVVHLCDLTAARSAYRIAVRTVQMLGAATVDGIAAQVRATTHSVIDQRFVEGLLSGLPRSAGSTATPAGSGSCSVQTRCWPICERSCPSLPACR